MDTQLKSLIERKKLLSHYRKLEAKKGQVEIERGVFARPTFRHSDSSWKRTVKEFEKIGEYYGK